MAQSKKPVKNTKKDLNKNKGKNVSKTEELTIENEAIDKVELETLENENKTTNVNEPEKLEIENEAIEENLLNETENQNELEATESQTLNNNDKIEASKNEESSTENEAKEEAESENKEEVEFENLNNDDKTIEDSNSLELIPNPQENDSNNKDVIVDKPKIKDSKNQKKLNKKESKQQEDLAEPYLLKKGQPILKTWRILLPYVFAFLYNLILVVALLALFILPILKLDASTQSDVISKISELHWFSDGNKGETLISVLGFGGSFDGLVSVADIVMAHIQTMSDAGELPLLISNLFGLVSFTLIFVVLIIWFTIKLIHSFVALITCVFKHRKRKIIDGFFFKNTNQYYSLGILDYDFAFVVYIIYSIFFIILANAKAIATTIIKNEKISDFLKGITAFRAFENSDLSNHGISVFFVLIIILVIIRIIYRIFVILLSKKVKKSYVYNKKRERKLAKKSSNKNEKFNEKVSETVVSIDNKQNAEETKKVDSNEAN